MRRKLLTILLLVCATGCSTTQRASRDTQQTAAPMREADNWGTFSNRAGWSINYPSDWRISSCRNCSDPTDPNVFVDFFPPDPDEGWLLIDHLMDKPKNASVDDWLNEMKKAANLSPIIHEAKLTVNDLPALSVNYQNPSDGGYEIDVVYIVSDQHTFSISFNPNKPGINPETLRNYPTYLRVLSTFKVKP
jgi:predicted small secreted protein